MVYTSRIVCLVQLALICVSTGCASPDTSSRSVPAAAADSDALQGEWIASVGASTSRDFPYLLNIEGDVFERVHIFMSCDASMTVTKERGRLVESERGLEIRLAEIEFQTNNHQSEPCGDTSSVTPPEGVFDRVRMIGDAFVIETIEGEFVVKSLMYRRRDDGARSPSHDPPNPAALVPGLPQPSR